MKSRHQIQIVTDGQARTEQALRASELSYRRLFEAAKDGILILDASTGRITDVNRFLVKLLGYSHSEMIGKTVGELSPFKDVMSNQSMLEQLQKDGYVRYHDLPLETKDGRKIAVEFVSNVYQAGDKKVIQCNIRDITERKRIEEELRWKTAFLEAKVESDLDGILVVNDQGKKVLQNKRMSVLWKIPPQVADNKDDAVQVEFVTKQTKNPRLFADKVAYLYAHPDEVSRDEIELIDGTVLDRYSSPVRGTNGTSYGRIWTFRDITERKKLERQFRQSQKMEAVGQLTGGVAHDFNNILAIIQMQAGLLKGGGGLSAEQLEFTEEISTTVERAAGLTRQLLLFSRNEVMRLSDLDLNKSIGNMAKMLERIIGENIRMEVKLSAEPMFIHADAGMMEQVLMNLTVNARDAMPNNGQLVIETSGVEFDEFAAAQSAQARPGSFVCLSVSDTGCGIPPEILSKIFDPFFTTKDVGKGTGLGLATTFGIVQQHEGWISVYSEVGRGTTFRIYLPRLVGNTVAKSSQAELTTVRGGDETILLVEDDPSLRASVRKALVKLGYGILEASTGVKALEVWKENRDEIRLLLTDLVMPDGITGKDLAANILQDNPKLKVIYMSGYSAEVVGKDFPLKEGVNFLTKPFQAVKLAQTIRDRLDAPA